MTGRSRQVLPAPLMLLATIPAYHPIHPVAPLSPFRASCVLLLQNLDMSPPFRWMARSNHTGQVVLYRGLGRSAMESHTSQSSGEQQCVYKALQFPSPWPFVHHRCHRLVFYLHLLSFPRAHQEDTGLSKPPFSDNPRSTSSSCMFHNSSPHWLLQARPLPPL